MVKGKNKKYRKEMNFYTIDCPSFDCWFDEDVPVPAEPAHLIKRSSFILEYQVTNINETANSTSRKRKNGKSTS